MGGTVAFILAAIALFAWFSPAIFPEISDEEPSGFGVGIRRKEEGPEAEAKPTRPNKTDAPNPAIAPRIQIGRPGARGR